MPLFKHFFNVFIISFLFLSFILGLISIFIGFEFFISIIQYQFILCIFLGLLGMAFNREETASEKMKKKEKKEELLDKF